MSRHRHIRNLAYDDYDDDYDMEEEEEDAGKFPLSRFPAFLKLSELVDLSLCRRFSRYIN